MSRQLNAFEAMKRENFAQTLNRIKQGSDDALVAKLSAHLQSGNQKICQLKPGGETVSWRMSEEGVMEKCDHDIWHKNLRILRENNRGRGRGRGRGGQFGNRRQPY